MPKAVCILAGGKVTGTLWFEQPAPKKPLVITGNIEGLTEGQHGIHIHEFGDNTNGCISTGGHFNPDNKEHGGPNHASRHAGDLGNITAGEDKVAKVYITDNRISICDSNNILGRSLVVHADPDDLGEGGHESSKINGNAGVRLACGVIGITQ